MNTNPEPRTPEDLPAFPVNVVATRHLRNSDLQELLARFRKGEVEPLVFGDNNRPEAAVVPFSAFVRLMRHDHATHLATEGAFQQELSDRISDSTKPSVQVTVEELAEQLGPVGQAWAVEKREQRNE